MLENCNLTLPFPSEAVWSSLMVIVTLSVAGDAPGDDADASGGETTRQEGVVGRRKKTLAKKPAANTRTINTSRMFYLLRKYSISIAYSKPMYCNNKVTSYGSKSALREQRARDAEV